MLTDEQFINKIQAQCTEAILYGCIMDLMWLETSKKYVETHAGNWVLNTNVHTMERLIELAKKGLDKPKPTIKITVIDSLISTRKVT